MKYTFGAIKKRISEAASTGSMKAVRQEASAIFEAAKLDDEANSGMVMSFIVVAILLVIGVTVLSSVLSASPALNENDTFFETQKALTGTITSGYGLMAIVLVVMAAAGILATLAYFKR